MSDTSIFTKFSKFYELYNTIFAFISAPSTLIFQEDRPLCAKRGAVLSSEKRYTEP